MGSPDSLRENIDARSKRKPSTCISETQYLKLSRIKRFTTEWLALRVLPVPV